jgi:site-specific DNA recombinase
MQKQTSIEDQVRECRQFIERKQWELADGRVYSDYAISGADANRSGYLALKTDAFKKQFDCIVVDDLSRLGRDAGEAIRIFQELTVIGINIVGVTDGIDSGTASAKLPFYFKSIMNEVFLDDLKAKIVRGLKGQVSRGYSAGGRTYGYYSEPELIEGGGADKFGRPLRHGVKIKVNEKEAEVVRLIFQLRIDGLGQRAIATRLNELKIPSPFAHVSHFSGSWSPDTVRSMLQQRRYIGDWTWNKSRSIKKSHLGKRIVREKAAEEWIAQIDESLRIIPQECWDAVQATFADAEASAKFAPGSKGVYLLAGLLKCSKCGSSLVGMKSNGWIAYACSGSRNRGRVFCSAWHRLPLPDAESGVLQASTEILSSDATLELIAGKVNAALAAIENQSPKRRDRQASRLKALDMSIQHLLNLAETDPQSPSLSNRLRDLEAEKRTIQAELNALRNQTQTQSRISEESIRGSLQGYLATLSADEGNRQELKFILGKMFPEKLSVTIREKKGYVEFDVLGKMLPFNLLPNASAIMYKAGEGTRTPDLLITNQLLYQLSYTGLRYLLVVKDDRHPDRQD